MDPITLISLGAGVLFVLGVPILVIIGLWCVGGCVFAGLSLANLGTTLFEGLNSYSLLAMPLFVATGDLIGASGIAKRLTDFAYACMCWFRGGLAMASIMACGFFAAISGSNSATAATIGSIMHPEMTKDGYDKKFAAATVAAGGTVGIIIPPSIVFITYGFLMNLCVSDLFLAGLFPGILMCVCMGLVAFFLSWKNKWGTVKPLSVKRIGSTALHAYLGFFAIGLILYGIYTGQFSPTESAAVCVGFCLIAGTGITRQIKLRALPDLFFKSGRIVGMIIPLVGVSMVMQQCLSALEADKWLFERLSGYGYTGIMIASVIIIFIVGMLMESIPAITIVVPILAPIAHAAGVDPVHYATIVLVGMAIGFVTPPFGLNLFVASAVCGVSYAQIVKPTIWYIAALLVAWGLTIFFPALCLV
ncbi:TRAP transporter [Desulfobulbus sp. Tol-SR]|nr:TRAP transporter [Desulfobulbus sp. Tol-SR]